MSNYNGWKNRATWNVALWVGNDYNLHQTAVEYVKQSRKPTWGEFVKYAGLIGDKTPDGFKYDGKALSRKELSNMLREMRREGG